MCMPYEFMEQENLYDKMENFAADMEEAAGTDMYMRARADGYRQVYAGVVGLLDQMYALMGDEENILTGSGADNRCRF